MYFSLASLSVLFTLAWFAGALSDQLDVGLTASHSYSVQPKAVPARLGHHHHAQLRKSSNHVLRRGQKFERTNPHVGIIGHVDHGKTTLHEGIKHTLSVSTHSGGAKTYDTIDHGSQEKERGITITSHKTKGKRWISRGVRATTNFRRQSGNGGGKSNLNVRTLGHIDHGKTSLTTGITHVLGAHGHGGGAKTYDDIDNAPEEKVRGITISTSHKAKGKRWVDGDAQAGTSRQEMVVTI